jgi:hypothetical protein
LIEGDASQETTRVSVPDTHHLNEAMPSLNQPKRKSGERTLKRRANFLKMTLKRIESDFILKQDA